MEKEYFITITGQKFCYGDKPFVINRVVKIVKEPDNQYDTESIRVELPFIGKIGYVANSVNTVIKGTISGGRLYEKFGTVAYAKIMFMTSSGIIALVQLDNELEALYPKFEPEKDEIGEIEVYIQYNVDNDNEEELEYEIGSDEIDEAK